MIDLTAMLINLSHSLQPLQKAISGIGYVFGIAMVVAGLAKLKNVLEMRQGGHNEGVFSGAAYIFGGAVLIYLPTSVSTMSNTFFGSSNVLSYSTSSPDPLYNAIIVLIETTGLLWFVRGTYLLVFSSRPGDDKIGLKGLTFLVAGILAMNIEATISFVTNTLTYIISLF